MVPESSPGSCEDHPLTEHLRLNRMTMPDSFLWHDYETFGADSRRDRPAQFAALRTNAELEPIDEPVMLYCKPATDLLPQPDACLITGITPQKALRDGVPENEFAATIADLMAQPGTCSVGYNSLRFDDEFTRHLFWRNFLDPYAREYAGGNSRFDLIDLARMMRALRPEGLDWADREDGTPSFRLEHLAAANGLDTSHAHDAMADVNATLGLARRMRSAQPRLWQWALRLRRRDVVSELLTAHQPLLHTSARLPARHCATAAVLPIAEHPLIRSQWLVWNLREDPAPFFGMDVEDLSDRLWTPAADLPEGQQRLPVKLVRSNRCPMLAPMSVLTPKVEARLELDRAAIDAHAAAIWQQPAFIERLQAVFERPAGAAIDPELDLYGGFVRGPDVTLRERVRSLSPEQLQALNNPFEDHRLNELLFRYRARLWPALLTDEEQARWQDYRRRRLIDDPDLASIRLDDYKRRIAELFEHQPDHRTLLEDLAQWPQEIGADALRQP